MQKLTHKRQGITSIEYGIIATLIAIMLFVGTSYLGTNEKILFCKISSSIGTLSQTEMRSCYVADGVDNNYIDTSMGGNENVGDASNWASKDDSTESDSKSDTELANELAEAMNTLNAKDPIVGVYGLYNGYGNLITSYDQAEKTLSSSTRTSNTDWNDGRFAYTLGGDGTPYFEIATASGQIYYAERNGWSESVSLIQKSSNNN